jgi:hypothetical protein
LGSSALKSRDISVFWQAIDVRRFLIAIGLICIALIGFYIPLPLTRYPDDPEFIKPLLNFSTHAMLGIAPWSISISAFYFSKILFRQQQNQLLMVDPFARPVLAGALLIAFIWTLFLVADVYQWSTEPVRFHDLAMPAISLVGFQVVFIFIARLLDLLKPGYGFWILLLAISVSGIGLSVNDWLEKVWLGSAEMRILWFELFLLLTTLALSCVLLTVRLKSSFNSPQSLMISTLAAATAAIWIDYFVTVFFNSYPEGAIFVVDHGNMKKVLVFLLSTVLVALIWMRNPQVRKNLSGAVLPFTGISVLTAISFFTFGSGMDRMLSGAEALTAVALAAPLFAARRLLT